LYPTYAAYGGTDMLNRFWQLQKQYYKMKNGSFQGNSANPGGRGNLGELIHFWSGACQVDVKPFAVKAFGWNGQYEAWWQQARIDYPFITYADAPIDNGYKNICQNGGTLKSNYTIDSNVIDNNYATYYNVRKQADKLLYEAAYNSAAIAKIDKYAVIVTGDNSRWPQSWTLYGSNDEATWTALDLQETPAFTENKLTVPLPDNAAVYRYYRIDFEFPSGGQLRIAEIELWGTEHPSAPYDLKAKPLTNESVALDWSCEMEEIDHLELERSTNGVTFAKVADLSRYEIACTDENLAPGAYFYRIGTVNKNAQKDKVYSNVAHVNTNELGMNSVEQREANFWYVLNNLDKYPYNGICIYNTAGRKVFESSRMDNKSFTEVASGLKSGVYIVKIMLEKESLLLSGKIIK
jgi:hypothetical protein